MRRATSALLVCLLALIPVLAVQADDVFRWVDKDGTVHYSDKPPSPDAKPAQLPKLQSFAPGAAGSLDTSPGGAGDMPTSSDNGVPSNYRPVISSPADDETIRDAQRHVTVTVTPPPPGVLLVFYLDGAAVSGAPTPSSAFLLNDVERGEHSVAVAAVSGDGRTLGRSANVTFFMMPPMVHK